MGSIVSPPKPKTRMGEFGDKFRKAREGKELTLDDVSNVIKISPRMLQAIEEQNFDRLPGGVFNKGFIRAYAKHLGLDPEEAITEYLDCIRQAQVDAQKAWETASPPQGQSVKSPAPKTTSPATPDKPPMAVAKQRAEATANRQPHAQAPPVEVEELPDLQLPREADLRPVKKSFVPPSSGGSSWRLFVVAGVVLALGIVLWTRRSRSTSPQTVSPKTVATNTSSGSSTPAPAAAPAQAPTNGQPAAPPSASTQAAPNAQPGAANSTTTASLLPNTSADSSSVEEKNDVTIRTFGTAAPPKTTESPAASFTLVIRATENSWLSIVADGQPVRQETLIAPAHTSVHATREVVVKVGNAAGVSFLFNGKEIAPQGNEAEPKTLVFDSSGLRAAP